MSQMELESSWVPSGVLSPTWLQVPRKRRRVGLHSSMLEGQTRVGLWLGVPGGTGVSPSCPWVDIPGMVGPSRQDLGFRGVLLPA